MAGFITPMIKLCGSILLKPSNKYYEIVLSRKRKLVIWDRPGLWCSDSELDQMVSDLKTVVANSKDREVPLYGVLLGEREDLKKRFISMVYDNNKPVAFSAQAHIDLTIGLKKIHVIHLGLVYVDMNIRGSGLTSMVYAIPNLLLLFRSGLRSCWVSNVTQVPSIFGLVEMFYSNPYPNTSDEQQSFEHYVIAQQIIGQHKDIFGVGEDCEYDPKNQIIKNAYTGGSDTLKKSFDETVKFRDEKVNEKLKDALDYERGDDYLQLAVLDYKLIFRFLGAKAIKSKKGVMLLNLVFLFFTSLLVPVFRWVIPEEDNV